LIVDLFLFVCIFICVFFKKWLFTNQWQSHLALSFFNMSLFICLQHLLLIKCHVKYVFNMKQVFLCKPYPDSPV
jgi:hypothetical protein